ncbi:MAG TPA: NADH-quinone oxidoreductase subunit A [Planctomycetota bacterium]|nr:NADH-quinone oxidoreductase subunit A [Planctomycetota bacterium]
MEVSLFHNLGNVFVFALFACIFVIANVSIISRLLRPSKKEAAKETTYECGEPPIGSSWVRFDMRFYSVALVFLIFDVEVAVMYPWARVFKELAKAGPFVYGEMFFFALVLGVGLVHVWKKNDLDWVKDVSIQEARKAQANAAIAAPPPAAPATTALSGTATGTETAGH